MIQKLIEWFLSLFNLGVYSPFELTLFGIGFISWVLAYTFIIRNTLRYQISEMPLIVAAGNLAWEFCWSFLFQNDLGIIFTWGCRVWFLMDIFINYKTVILGRKLVTNSFIVSNYLFWYIFCLLSWFGIVYFISIDGLDDKLGVVSAMLINVVMSALYIYQLLNYSQYRNRGFCIAVAWLKMVGTATISLGSAIVWPENGFLLTMCVITFILDLIYIYLFYRYKGEVQI